MAMFTEIPTQFFILIVLIIICVLIIIVVFQWKSVAKSKNQLLMLEKEIDRKNQEIDRLNEKLDKAYEEINSLKK